MAIPREAEWFIRMRATMAPNRYGSNNCVGPTLVGEAEYAAARKQKLISVGEFADGLGEVFAGRELDLGHHGSPEKRPVPVWGFTKTDRFHQSDYDDFV
jgi:hypothetical protein